MKKATQVPKSHSHALIAVKPWALRVILRRISEPIQKKICTLVTFVGTHSFKRAVWQFTWRQSIQKHRSCIIARFAIKLMPGLISWRNTKTNITLLLSGIHALTASSTSLRAKSMKSTSVHTRKRTTNVIFAINILKQSYPTKSIWTCTKRRRSNAENAESHFTVKKNWLPTN